MSVERAQRQLAEMADKQTESIAAKARTVSLDELRFEAGKLDGLKLALQILAQESNGNSA